jgi:predicted class III extradiol MEMO1 family dioxygenase
MIYIHIYHNQKRKNKIVPVMIARPHCETTSKALKVVRAFIEKRTVIKTICADETHYGRLLYHGEDGDYSAMFYSDSGGVFLELLTARELIS